MMVSIVKCLALIWFLLESEKDSGKSLKYGDLAWFRFLVSFFKSEEGSRRVRGDGAGLEANDSNLTRVFSGDLIGVGSITSD